MFGRDGTRNAVSDELNPPLRWRVEGMERLNVKWEAELGNCRNCSTPVVAGGLVWVGTNNNRPRDPEAKQDAAVLMCFRASDGKFLWQFLSPRLDNPFQDFPNAGLNCLPLVEYDRLYCTTNRAEVVCFDIAPLHQNRGEPRLLWKLDMRKELGVSPAGPTCPGIGFVCAIGASCRGRIYVTTGNGVGEDQMTAPAPQAASLLCIDQTTGKVLWSDNSPGKNILHSQWSSPLVVEVAKRVQVIAAQGDGWVRSFDTLTGELIWKFDTNPKSAAWKLGGRGTRNYLPATPVFHDGKVYIGNGQAELNGDGVGHLWCIDATRVPKNREKDLSPVDDNFDPNAELNKDSGLVWHYGGPTIPGTERRGFVFGRTMSSVVVRDGLVIAPDLDGYVHCLDAKTGKNCWTYDVRTTIVASPLLVDGNVFIPDVDGNVSILAATRGKKLIAQNEVEEAIHSSPAFKNGVLFLASDKKLYAIEDAEGKDKVKNK